MIEKVKFKINSDNYSKLIQKLADLTTIDNQIRMIIDNEDILAFSMKTEGRSPVAFKNYILETYEYLTTQNEIVNDYELNILNASKLIKSLKFLEDTGDVLIEIKYKNELNDSGRYLGRVLTFKSKKLKIDWALSDSHLIDIEITKDFIREKLDLSNSLWSFDISTEDFNNIKKLSVINADEVVYINTKDNVVYIGGESSWQLQLGSCEYKNSSVAIDKKYLKTVKTSEDELTISIFPNFMLVKTEESNVFFAYEQDI